METHTHTKKKIIPPLILSSLFFESSEALCCRYLADQRLLCVMLTVGVPCTEFENLFCYEVYVKDKYVETRWTAKDRDESDICLQE